MRRSGWDWDAPNPHCPRLDDAGGFTRALRALPEALKSYERVGIVLDADMSPIDRWRAVRQRVGAAGLTIKLPDRPDPAGTVVHHEDGCFGAWLMPDNQRQGKLEDFLAGLVPDHDQCWQLAEHCTQQAWALGAAFGELDFIKARVHTWLAWQPTPGLPFGQSIRAGNLSTNAESAAVFIAWMERLFRTQP
jgi:hypothetical protein